MTLKSTINKRIIIIKHACFSKYSAVSLGALNKLKLKMYVLVFRREILVANRFSLDTQHMDFSLNLCFHVLPTRSIALPKYFFFLNLCDNFSCGYLQMSKRDSKDASFV